MLSLIEFNIDRFARLTVCTQEAKYIESWPNTTSALAGWGRFDIPVDRYGGVRTFPATLYQQYTGVSYLLNRLASRKILIE
jgi:hypothetical protein